MCRTRVRRLYADREFYATDVFSTLEHRDIFYVIPTPRADRVKGLIASMSDRVTVKSDHAVYGPVTHSVTNTSVVSTLVELPSDEDHDEIQVFATNLDVNDEIDLDRRWTKKQITCYRHRGRIETPTARSRNSHRGQRRQISRFGCSTLRSQSYSTISGCL